VLLALGVQRAPRSWQSLVTDHSSAAPYLQAAAALPAPISSVEPSKVPVSTAPALPAPAASVEPPTAPPAISSRPRALPAARVTAARPTGAALAPSAKVKAKRVDYGI
jgi:hypothetical protein